MKTPCERCEAMLSPFIDGELRADDHRRVEQHLAGCPSCADALDALRRTSKVIREGSLRYQAPDILRARVRDAVRAEASARPRAAAPWRGWQLVAAGLLIAAVSSGITWLALGARTSATASLEQELVASHLRSLVPGPGHLTDVASNNSHNVKPWFNGRVDFSPSAPQVDSVEFPLLGGRVDYVGGRPVAVVVYGRRKHVINAYSWPQPGPDSRSLTRDHVRGFNIVHWTRDGLATWVVSDVSEADLLAFSNRLMSY